MYILVFYILVISLSLLPLLVKLLTYHSFLHPLKVVVRSTMGREKLKAKLFEKGRSLNEVRLGQRCCHACALDCQEGPTQLI